ncbi:MAG: hypothetical protein H6964_14975 [Chromatiaceae bacterium]|nr:hypothetical protein [Gammaproteobacteria bacterium]MCP5448276.1 hypothetical protein [Chromatiaceae bacterium]
MSLLGTTVALLVGPSVPLPAPVGVMEALDSIQVTTSDSGRSGFQLSLRVGRGRSDLLDYALQLGPLLQPFSRVVLIVSFGGLPEVLMDGIITNQQFSPSSEPGTSTLTLTGEDVSVMMDMEERSVEHPAQPEMAIAAKIIATYAQYGLIPMVIPPPSLDMPIPIERIPVQQATDLEYLNAMAERFAYVFYVMPGPAPLTNTAYWGPPIRAGIPQRALSANMGSQTNVNSIDFEHDGLAATTISGSVHDRRLNSSVPVQTFASLRIPLARPSLLAQRRVRRFRGTGLDTMQAFARAQAETDRSHDQVVKASGELDALRYEAILKPRALVGVRGVGDTYNGFYYVQQVSHSISKGSYTQRFSLEREGTGATTPVVVP